MHSTNYTFLHSKNYLYSKPVNGLQGYRLDYRFAFNGKEQDNEGMGGGGSTYDYGFRIYNVQLGRFLSVDPLTQSYPFYTPYQFAGNKPIIAIDIDGLEEWIIIRRIDFGKNIVTSSLKYNPGHRGQGVQYQFIKVGGSTDGGTPNLGTLNYPDFIPGTIDKKVSQQTYKYYESQNDAINDVNPQRNVLGKNGRNISQDKFMNPLQPLSGRNYSTSIPPMTEYYADNLFSGSNFNAGAVADLLMANPVLYAKIEGFTDSKNTDAYNLDLSKKRAFNLRNAIINAAKASNKYTEVQIQDLDKRITSEGKGEEAAKAANGDNVDDSNSRKTTVTITTKETP